VITCGRTEEEIDPVRVLTNRSSGRMGVSLANAFLRRGADVTLIAGKTSVPLPYGVKVTRILTASEMLSELEHLIQGADALIMAAAVADYMPVEGSAEKIKDDEITIRLKKTPDILASLDSQRPVRIGFSVETGEDWTSTAEKKLKAKRLDAIVANPSRAAGSDRTEACIIFASGRRIKSMEISKDELAGKVLEITRELIEERSG
jgi:phosphopantothenoylcysteine decarboxylase/phosphopantothenate--cysteine ligase